MASIYKRLLKYQKTDNRSNLENFSTEILCDYLNRLSIDTISLFLRNVVFYSLNSSVLDAFIENHETEEESIVIYWETQYSISISGIIKYPDLIGFINHKPAILIEVKIGAGFTHREDQNEMGDTVYIPQLQDYGCWLKEKNANAILVLLSHYTTPPDDFFTSEDKYGVKQRNYITWNQVYQWLRIVNEKSQEQCLTQDFMKYLVEQNMAIESPIKHDFSVLELFVSDPGKRIKDMMKYIREELEKKFKTHMSWGKEKSSLNDGLYTFDFDQKIIWSWVILESSEYAYLAWGMCFPDGEDEWEWRTDFPSLPKVPFIFVGIFSDKKKIKDNYESALDLRPDDWYWNNNIKNDSGIDLIGIQFRNFNEFLSYDQDSTKEIFNFIDLGFRNISKLVNKIVQD